MTNAALSFAAAFAHPSLAAMNRLDVLRLIRSENVGPITFFSLIRRYGNATDALEALPELAARGGRGKPLVACPADTAQREMEETQTFGARLIAYGEMDYPELLLQIPDPPPILAVSGSADVWRQKRPVAIVGARNASASGCAFATQLARELGKANCAIVSGLARGIDASVHKAAFNTGTIGVIAGGIDHIYPPENESLFLQLREHGAIISEHPFGAAPLNRHFPARNRIIAGMSEGVVVVEASLKSGSLITASCALEYNRDVFAVPGSPLDPRCHGTNKLLRDGAAFTESADDVLSVLRHHRMEETHAPAYASVTPAPADERELTRTRALVLEKLGPTPVHLDELLAQCQVTPGLLHTALLELELAGKLTRSASGRISRSYENE